jgi:cobaltochelatase CobT
MAAWRRSYAGAQPAPWTARHAAIGPGDAASRGGADALAAWQRRHPPQIDGLFSAAQWPWYAVLERARVETLAGQHLPGIAHNLRRPQDLQPAWPALAGLYLQARQALGGPASTPPDARPTAMAAQAAPVWSRWLRRAKPPAPAPTEAQWADTLRQARAVLGDGPAFARAVWPLVQALALSHGQAPLAPPQLPGPPGRDGDAEPPHPRPDARDASAGGPGAEPGVEPAYPGYAVWSHLWDEQGPAARWHTPQDDEALHRFNAIDRRQARQLAHRLQRRLLASRLRRWDFDQEEGRLDSRRLARLQSASSGAPPRVFRTEAEAALPEACVTLLVDQSGSMRGARQWMTALAIDLAVHSLQACQVACEVLGYTTAFGAANPLLRQWQQAGRPARPGRLNALRHIVFKTPAQPWQRARAGLGLLLREDFGHENIDGEALHWAACRLLRQPQPRKILIVLSDGAPFDAATSQAQGRAYLEDHLRDVIARIEAGPIQLVAIGAGQDVGRFYRHAITLRQPDAAPAVLFDGLARLLAPAPRREPGRLA